MWHPTFCQVLSQKDLKFNELLDILVEFIGNFQCSEDDINALKSLFDLTNTDVVQTLKHQKLHWMPM